MISWSFHVFSLSKATWICHFWLLAFPKSRFFTTKKVRWPHQKAFLMQNSLENFRRKRHFDNTISALSCAHSSFLKYRISGCACNPLLIRDLWICHQNASKKLRKLRKSGPDDGLASKKSILMGGKLSVSTTILEIIILLSAPCVLWETLQDPLLLIVFRPNGYFPWVGNESSFLVTDPLVG